MPSIDDLNGSESLKNSSTTLDKPRVVEFSGFQVDLVNKCATQEVKSSDGHKYKIVVPLKSDDYESYLANFSLSLCQKVADLSAALQVGVAKQGKEEVSRIGLRVDFERGQLDTVTKQYAGNKESKTINAPLTHYQDKLAAVVGDAGRVARLQRKIDAIDAIGRYFIGLQKDAEWSLFDHDITVTPVKDSKPAGGTSRKDQPKDPATTDKPAATTDSDSPDEGIGEEKPWYSRWWDNLKSWF
jgi:hypothetical protein